MSIKVMNLVLDSDDLKSSEKFVLAILADFGNDNGESIYPSINRIAKRTSLTTRAVKNILGNLEKGGFIRRVGRSGYTSLYTIVIHKLGGGEARSPVNQIHRGGERTSPGGVNQIHRGGERTSPDPLFNPYIDPLLDSGKPPQTKNGNSKTENGETRIEDSSSSKRMENQTPPSSGQPPIQFTGLPKLTPLDPKKWEKKGRV